MISLEKIFPTRIQTLLLCCLIALPAIIYLIMVYRHAINIPYQDDYDAALVYIGTFNKSSFSDKLGMLFAQHNEHRIFYPRMVILMHYWITGNINFRHLILFNAIQLIGVFTLCTYFIKKCLPQYWLPALLILSIGLFDLNNYENALCSLAGLFNIGILFLFLSTMFLYSLQSKYWLIAAVICQIAMTFSGGNGIVASFFIAFFLLLENDKRKLIIAAATMVLTAPLYYYKFQSSTVLYFSTDVSTVGRVFFNAIGANFGMEIGYLMGIVVMVVLVLVFPFNKSLDFRSNRTAPLIALAMFILSSMLIMAFFRAKLPVVAAYSSRYAIYTHILAAIICVFLFHKYSQPRVLLSVAVLFSFFYFMNYNAGDAGFDNILGSLRNTKYNYPSPETGKAVTDEACRTNVYCIEAHRADSYRKK